MTVERRREEVVRRPVGLRRRVLRGGLLMGLVSVGMRGSSMLAQLILGRILVDRDFGLWALALGFVAIGPALRSVLRPVLIEAEAKAPATVGRIFSNTMWAVLLFSAAGIALTPLVGRVLDEPSLPPLLALLLLVLPLQVVPVVGLARISNSLEFNRFGGIVATAGLARHVVTVLAAILGLGPYSFLIGAASSAIMETVIVHRLAGPIPRLLRPRIGAVRPALDRLAPERRWIWLTAVALALALTGDYLGASFFASTALLGVYYFGYQLTGALFEPMNLAANTVLVPAFLRIEDVALRRTSFIETIRALTVFGSLFFFVVAVAAAPLTHLLWSGIWDPAIFAIVAFAAYAPIRMVHPSSQSIARGCGLWSLFASDMVVVGSVTFASALVGAAVGGLRALVLFVVVGHFLVTVSTTVRLARSLGAPLIDALGALLLPWLVGMGGLGLVEILTAGVTSTDLAGLPTRVALLVGYLLVGLVVPYRRVVLDNVRTVIARG